MADWQPIATAPDTLATLLVIHEDDLYPVPAYRLEGIWYRETDGPEDESVPGRHMQLYRQPTHWMPCPDPPEVPRG